MRLRRDPLRSDHQTDHDVQLPLSRLPAHYRERVYTCCLCAGEGIQDHEGSPRYYSTPSEMVGHNKRGFCPECGSRLFGGETEQGQGITASSLDDPSLFKPKVNMWISDAQPWDHMDPNLPKFEKYPPQG
jgi:hypothetical protein